MPVWVVGAVDPRLLGLFGPVKHMPRACHEPLVELLGLSGRVLTLPHVLAEVSNLAGKLPGAYRRPFFLRLAALLERPLEELAMASRRAGEAGELLPRLGLTDALLIVAAAEDVTAVLTEDEPLANELNARGTET